MGFSFHFSRLYPAPFIELYVFQPIKISYVNFRAVLVLPKTAGSAQTHKSMIFLWIVWSTLYVYLCHEVMIFDAMVVWVIFFLVFLRLPLTVLRLLSEIVHEILYEMGYLMLVTKCLWKNHGVSSYQSNS